MRIQGVTLPDKKRIEYALTEIFGIGHSRALSILQEVKVDPGTKPTDLSPENENAIRAAVEQFKIEGDLRREVSSNVKRFKDISSYRGSRHAKRLPANGQRSKTNSRTVRGNVRKTMGSGRTKVDKK
jgi:small subunit ribosomal protein S13